MSIPLAVPLALQGLSAAGNLYGAYQASKPLETQAISPGEISGYMSPIQGVINQMQGSRGQMTRMGQQMMDPGSAYNLQQKQLMQEQGASQLALQNLLQARQNAATGVDSGIVRAQQRAQQQGLSQSLGQQYQNMLAQNRAQGLGILGNQQSLLGSIGQLQMGVSENIGQAAISQRQQQMAEELRRRQAMSNMFGATSSGLSGMAIGMLE